MFLTMIDAILIQVITQQLVQETQESGKLP